MCFPAQPDDIWQKIVWPASMHEWLAQWKCGSSHDFCVPYSAMSCFCLMTRKGRFSNQQSPAAQGGLVSWKGNIVGTLFVLMVCWLFSCFRTYDSIWMVLPTILMLTRDSNVLILSLCHWFVGRLWQQSTGSKVTQYPLVQQSSGK